MSNLKVGDIFVISKKDNMVYDYSRILELSKDHNQIYLDNLLINLKLLVGLHRTKWYPKNIMDNVKKATRKDWYRAVRQYNEINI